MIDLWNKAGYDRIPIMKREEGVRTAEKLLICDGLANVLNYIEVDVRMIYDHGCDGYLSSLESLSGLREFSSHSFPSVSGIDSLDDLSVNTWPPRQNTVAEDEKREPMGAYHRMPSLYGLPSVRRVSNDTPDTLEQSHPEDSDDNTSTVATKGWKSNLTLRRWHKRSRDGDTSIASKWQRRRLLLQHWRRSSQ